MRASPLEIQARIVRPLVLGAWLRESMQAHRAVAVLLCDEAECARLSSARSKEIGTALLRPTYGALAWRYERNVTDGRQLELFSPNQDAELRLRWSLFAIDYVRRRRGAQVQRWVLEATVGLPGGADPTTAANLLLSDALYGSLFW